MAVLYATVFKSIIFEKTAEIDVEEIKEFSQKLNQSSRKQFEGIYFSDKYVNKIQSKF